jgi:hypothetical protein
VTGMGYFLPPVLRGAEPINAGVSKANCNEVVG